MSPQDTDASVATGSVRVFMSAEDKRGLLTAKRTVAAIRRVARSRGVPSQEHGDVVQQTCARAWKARLPVDPTEARKVVNRIAFTVACMHMRVDPKGVPQSYEEHCETPEVSACAADPAPDHVLREEVQRLLDKARAKFPKRFDGFLASVLSRSPAAEEAARRGVSEAHVRKERSQIRQFLELHGHKMHLLPAASLLLLLVIGSMHAWTESNVTNPDTWSDVHSVRRVPPPPAMDAASLRERAAEEFRTRSWEACIDDLDAAKAIDGRPDTPDETEMRIQANDALRMEDAPMGPLK